MYVLVGPNGAGKSTLYEQRLGPMTDVPFVNAHDIRKERQAQGEMLDAYAAARLAAATRDAYLNDQCSFVTETVFSHSSKLDLIRHAKAQGFRVVIFHVNVQSAAISVARVRFRATQGGHDVPEHKIRDRYARNPRYIRAAVALCDLAQVFDNSKANAPPRHIPTFKHAQLDKAVGDMPGWATAIYGL